MKKYKIIYVYDALCSWCYGFDNIMTKLYEENKDKFDFEIISGGMFTGPAISPIQDISAGKDFRSMYKRITDMSGANFTEKYLTGLFEEQNYLVNSELPAYAFSVFKSYPVSKGREFEFVNLIQSLIFTEGMNPNNDEIYIKIAKHFNIDEKEFLAKMAQDDFKYEARQDFDTAKILQVSSFPQVLIEVAENSFYLVAKGFTELDIIKQRLKNIIAEVEQK